MKHIAGILIFFFFGGQLTLQGQVAINTDASLPDASAMLDVKSTTRGVLAPRVKTSERLLIVSPADGLWVYDTDTQGFWYYKMGTGWQQIPNSSGALTLPFSASLNSVSTLFALSNTGSGMAISGNSTGGTGIYGVTGSLSSAGLLADNLSGGEGVTGRTASVGGTPTGAVVGRNDGPGYGLSGFIATDNTGTGIGVLGRVGISGSTGIAGHFENLNAANAATTLEAVTNGTGNGATVVNLNASNTANTLNVSTNTSGVISNHSTGNAGNFFNNNTSGVGAGVRGEVNSIFGNNGTAGVYGTASGTGGYGGYFEHSNTTGFGNSLYAGSAGLGTVVNFENTNAANAQPVLQVVTIGTGNACALSNTNSSNTANTLNVTTNTQGVIANHSTGNAGNFFNNNTSGVGAGVRGEVNSIFGNNGTAGVYGVASGTGGYAGYFEHSETTGFGVTLQVISNDQGYAMMVDHEGTGNLAAFQAGGINVARIDHSGRGFFNGGTQNSGADLAEAFDVEGSVAAYEPGDVLLISTQADRTLVKSNAAYSSLVAGVYATKPGVLLTEESGKSSLADKIPMGVVGVIPTKVCKEGGSIHRGDILVTSSIPGCAMKADLNKLKPGQAIGKALEEFNGTTGKIKVLVNVK
ncbi:beta strand repeat-containing protein [Flavitalea flava]